MGEPCRLRGCGCWGRAPRDPGGLSGGDPTLARPRGSPRLPAPTSHPEPPAALSSQKGLGLLLGDQDQEPLPAYHSLFTCFFKQKDRRNNDLVRSTNLRGKILGLGY